MTKHWQVPADTALLIIDPQNDFCSGGALAVPAGEEIMPVINAMRRHFSKVFISKDWHPAGHSSFREQGGPWPRHCEQDTDGAKFHGALKVLPADQTIHKGTNPAIDSYSAFLENDKISPPRFENGQSLAERMRTQGIKRIILSGLAFDYCVGWSALDAVDAGFEVLVAEDATRGIAPDSMNAMHEQLIARGVKIINSEELSKILGATQTHISEPKLNP